MNSTIAEILRPTGTYSCDAERYVEETRDRRYPGQRVAHSRGALAVLRSLAVRSEPCGCNGWLMVYEDGSAIVANSIAERIWRRWPT
jgi:hypothetical protein